MNCDKNKSLRHKKNKIKYIWITEKQNNISLVKQHLKPNKNKILYENKKM